jgi:hypothetical protein
VLVSRGELGGPQFQGLEDRASVGDVELHSVSRDAQLALLTCAGILAVTPTHDDTGSPPTVPLHVPNHDARFALASVLWHAAGIKALPSVPDIVPLLRGKKVDELVAYVWSMGAGLILALQADARPPGAVAPGAADVAVPVVSATEFQVSSAFAATIHSALLGSPPDGPSWFSYRSEFAVPEPEKIGGGARKRCDHIFLFPAAEKDGGDHSLVLEFKVLPEGGRKSQLTEVAKALEQAVRYAGAAGDLRALRVANEKARANRMRGVLPEENLPGALSAEELPKVNSYAACVFSPAGELLAWSNALEGVGVASALEVIAKTPMASDSDLAAVGVFVKGA